MYSRKLTSCLVYRWNPSPEKLLSPPQMVFAPPASTIRDHASWEYWGGNNLVYYPLNSPLRSMNWAKSCNSLRIQFEEQFGGRAPKSLLHAVSVEQEDFWSSEVHLVCGISHAWSWIIPIKGMPSSASTCTTLSAVVPLLLLKSIDSACRFIAIVDKWQSWAMSKVLTAYSD